MMPWLRSALFNIAFYTFLIVCMVLGAPTLLIGRRAVIRLAQIWAGASLWLLRVLCGTRVDFRGRENIPTGACLVAAKHQSFLEIIALVRLFPDFTFVLKRELTRIPLFGLYLSRIDQVAIDRTRGRAALAQVVEQAARVLAQGRPLFIFPEGTRQPPGAPARYKLGAGFVYAEGGVPCLPVALNTGLFWPRRAFLKRRGTAVIAFLPRIDPGLDRDGFQALLQRRIETETTRLIAEALRIDPTLSVPPDVTAATSGRT